MSAKITTLPGCAVPPAPRHSVTVHMPTWKLAESFSKDPASYVASFKNAYPRMKPHKDINELAAAVKSLVGAMDEGCQLFSSLQSATEAVEYCTSQKRDNGIDKSPIAPEKIRLRAFKAKNHFFAVFFPLDKRSVAGGFWTIPGVGLSSRFAEANLPYLDQLRESTLDEVERSIEDFDGPAQELLRERIVGFLNRAPIASEGRPRPATGDVYLFPSGMASIFKPHSYMLKLHQGTTVLFGMAFYNTVQIFDEFGFKHKFLGVGTDDDLLELEKFLKTEHKYGRKVQAIWAEFPANPILVTPDITRLRALADQYDAILAIDDTIGSFANVDVTGVADLVVTSLTKSFNGYADAIAGCSILNPCSNKYRELKSLFDQHYIPELYAADAEIIEKNSMDYLERTARLNNNASTLVEYLSDCAKDPKSAVKTVYYPSINASGKHYKKFMRPVADGFTPGYGCLFNVELEDLPTTTAFYDNLNVHNGPHLGAPFTLALPYTQCIYGTRLDFVARYNLRQTQVRVSAGLEDTTTLLADFRNAVEAANRVKSSGLDIKTNGC